MAAFPTLPILQSTQPVRLDGYVPVRATNGKLRVRKMYDSDKWEFPLQLQLTAAQWSSLESHYQAHKNLTFSFTWPTTGVTYTVMYMTAPIPQEQPGGWVKAVVRLGEQ